ncbi:MAG: glycoside hydrolase family 97 N-terminal domain-containing protein, partial [Bacteroidota bacterium]
MKNCLLISFLLLAFTCNAQTVQSPSKEITLNFSLSNLGKPTYEVSYKNKPVVLKSYLGIKLKAARDLDTAFRIDSIAQNKVNETWQPVLGEQSNIKNNYNEMVVALTQ